MSVIHALPTATIATLRKTKRLQHQKQQLRDLSSIRIDHKSKISFLFICVISLRSFFSFTVPPATSSFFHSTPKGTLQSTLNDNKYKGNVHKSIFIKMNDENEQIKRKEKRHDIRSPNIDRTVAIFFRNVTTVTEPAAKLFIVPTA